MIAVHLEWNLSFLVGEDRTLIAYDMNLRKVLVLLAQVVWYHRPTWRLHSEGPHYLPYVPLFMESVKLHMLFFLQVGSCFDSIYSPFFPW